MRFRESNQSETSTSKQWVFLPKGAFLVGFEMIQHSFSESICPFQTIDVINRQIYILKACLQRKSQIACADV